MKLEDLTAFGEKDLDIPRRAEEISKNYLDAIQKQAIRLSSIEHKLTEKFNLDLRDAFSDTQKFHINGELNGVEQKVTVHVKNTKIVLEFKQNSQPNKDHSKIYQIFIKRDANTEAFLNIEILFEELGDLYFLEPIEFDYKKSDALQKNELIQMEKDTEYLLVNNEKIQQAKKYKYHIIKEKKRVSGSLNEGKDLQHIIERVFAITRIFED